MQSTYITSSANAGLEQFLANATKQLVAFGQFGNGIRLEITQIKPNLTQQTIEAITMHLVENFSVGNFPEPQAFTDREIAVIGSWEGLDEQGTFGHIAGEESNGNYGSQDERIIEKYGLDVTAGQNTWPQFAVILKQKKEAWATLHPTEAGKLRSKELLEEAIEACAVAGMSHGEIMAEAQSWCDEICA